MINQWALSGKSMEQWVKDKMRRDLWALAARNDGYLQSAGKNLTNGKLGTERANQNLAIFNYRRI